MALTDLFIFISDHLILMLSGFICGSLPTHIFTRDSVIQIFLCDPSACVSQGIAYLFRCVCVYVCVPDGPWVLITRADGSCLKPCVSCNDSRVSVIICLTEPSLHIHCCSPTLLTPHCAYVTHLKYIQILSREWLHLVWRTQTIIMHTIESQLFSQHYDLSR